MKSRRRLTLHAAVVAGGLLALASPARPESYILPSSAFRSGSNAAEYRTDVRILNQGVSAVTVNATFYEQVTSTTIPANPFRIEARSQASFDNILASLFARSLSQGAFGPIRFESTGPILVAASVNNVNTCGNGAVSGQWLPGISTTEALTSGAIGQLAVSSSSGSGYRTNLVFVNPSSVAATATVRVRRGGGTLLSTKTIGPLSPNGFTQVGLDTFPGVAGMTDTNLWLEFTSNQPVLAYATMIHNVSGDPFAVVASSYNPPPDGPANEATFLLPGGVPLVMVRIPAGTFQMGAPTTERGAATYEQPVHWVTLTSDYYVGKHEVTQAQWQAVMGTAMPASCGGYGVGGDYPVSCVSWDDIHGAGGFIEKLKMLLGDAKFRLPTEAEWERAARGGTQTRFSFGEALDGDDDCGMNAAANPYVWWCRNATSQSHEVGTKTANPYGLYDVHGNVWEFVEDWYATYWATPDTNPTGPGTGSNRVIRGGGWYDNLSSARSGCRLNSRPSGRMNNVGFRLARSL